MSHYENEEEDLVLYFRQMLESEVETPAKAPAEPAVAAKPQVNENAVAAPDNTEAQLQAVGMAQVELVETVESAAEPAPAEKPSEPEVVADANESVVAEAVPEETPAEDIPQEDIPQAEIPAAEASAEPAAAMPEEIQDWPIESDSAAAESPAPEPQLERAPEIEAYTPKPQTRSLESLLQSVGEGDTVTETVTATETVTETQTETVTETETAVAEPETVTETVTETASETVTETEVEAQAETVKDESRTAETQLETEASAPAEPDVLQWQNVELPSEFQALFFMVRGVRFAVPLVDLGGIFEMGKLTAIVGRPHWHQGLIDIRGKKINVVDTMRWVKPDVMDEHEYSYLIVLGNSRWAVACDELEGNRKLSFDNVKWRKCAGSRPWLAGIVKKEMCALFHVQALTEMFERGFTLDGTRQPSTLPTFEEDPQTQDPE